MVTVHTLGALRDETAMVCMAAVQQHRIEWDVHEIEVGDPFAYGKIIAECWASGEDFAVVEPDIVIRPDVTEAFLECSEPYCAFPYAWLTDVGPALGCTRFRGAFTRKYPKAMQQVLDKNVGWNQLDVVLMRHVLVREHGEQPHVHLPAVRHLNEAKALLPNANPEPLMHLPAW